MLDELFTYQAELNKRIGKDMEDLHDRFDRVKAGTWLNDYMMAMTSEIEELRNCTYWKHWCAEAQQGRRFEIHDVEEARREVVDLLFFWISMAQCLGLTAQDVYRLYLEKLKINHQRQEDGYSMKEKRQSQRQAD